MKKLHFRKSWVFLPILMILGATLFTPLISGMNPPLVVASNIQNINTLADDGATNTAQTSIVVKAYTKAERVNQFVEKLLASNNLITKEDWTDMQSPLVDYVDFNNIPEDTKISLLPASIISSDSDGSVSFSMSVNHYFGADGVLRNDSKTFNLALVLQITNKPTTVVPNNSYPKNLTIAEFKAYVGDASGNALTDHLAKFVYVDSLPAGSTVKLEWAEKLEWAQEDAEGNIGLNIVPSSYYDADSSLITNTGDVYKIPVELVLSPDTATDKPATTLVSFDTFPIDANATTIYTQIRSGTNDVNYYWLSKFIDLSTLPYEAVLTFGANASNNPNTGAVYFNLNSDLVYNGVDTTPVASTKPFSFSWTLKGRIPMTTVSSIVRISRNLTVDVFLAEVAPNQVVDRAALSKYVDLSLVPEFATITLSDFDKNPTPGSISFTLVVNQYFNSESTVVYGLRAYGVQLNSLTEINRNSSPIDSWVYYVIGASIFVVILLTVFISLKIRDRDNSKFFEFEKFEKEADKIDPDKIDKPKH